MIPANLLEANFKFVNKLKENGTNERDKKWGKEADKKVEGAEEEEGAGKGTNDGEAEGVVVGRVFGEDGKRLFMSLRDTPPQSSNRFKC